MQIFSREIVRLFLENGRTVSEISVIIGGTTMGMREKMKRVSQRGFYLRGMSKILKRLLILSSNEKG
nr:MAG TPA: hypothetical protein [Bacteriophage sp.]